MTKFTEDESAKAQSNRKPETADQREQTVTLTITTKTYNAGFKDGEQQREPAKPNNHEYMSGFNLGRVSRRRITAQQLKRNQPNFPRMGDNLP